MSTPRRITVVTAVDAVADELRRRVLAGAYVPGAPLREVALCEEFGVGRHTLRAALGALAHEGLLVRQTNRGVFVPSLTSEDVRELYVVRTALEVEAARLVAVRRIHPQKALGFLEEMDAMREDAPWSAAVHADQALHQAFVEAVGNERLNSAYRAMTAEIRLCISQLRPFYGSPAQLAAEHRVLLEAIMSHEPEVAMAEVRAHLERGMDDLTSGAQPHPGLP